MISWKNSFKRLNEEYETTKKKKQALDNLLNAGRISQSTFDLFNKEMDEAVAELERQQKALLERMNSKINELEEQIKTLEMLFANFEIQHVAGELDEEVYQREIGLLSMGLETARQELDAMKGAMNQLTSGMQIPSNDVVVRQEIESQPSEVSPSKAEKAETVEETVSTTEEKLPKAAVEFIEVSETDSSQAQQEKQQETLESKEESNPTEEKTESEEKQEV